MKKQVKFGECLRLMLTSLDISGNRLSQAINVDSSLVSRWLNEKRVPSYRSNYIEEISKYFSANILNSFQEERLNCVIDAVCGTLETDACLKERILKTLLEAQGYSLECKKRVMDNSQKPISGAPFSLNSPLPLSDPLFKGQIVWGTANILHIGIDLIRSAVQFFPGKNSEKNIYISYNTDWLPAEYQENFNDWKNALMAATRHGWNIVFLLRLDYSLVHIQNFINSVKLIAASGKLKIYYLTHYNIPPIGREELIIPSLGALSCYSTKSSSTIDCAFFIQDRPAVNALSDYFIKTLSAFARPLIRYYTPKEDIEYKQLLKVNGRSPGKRFFYKKEFGLLTQPPELYQKLLKKKGPLESAAEDLDFYNENLNHFLANVKNNDYYNIYPLDIIDRLIQTKNVHLYRCGQIGLVKMNHQDIIDQLTYIIRLLQTYDHYHIGFIDLKQIETTAPYFVIIKEGNYGILDFDYCTAESLHIRFAINEPMIVQTLQVYFIDLWDKIAPIYKSKKDIIQWLQGKINSLKGSCHSLHF